MLRTPGAISPRALPPPALLAALVAVPVALAGACQVDRDAFYQQIFGCNPNAADPACGTDQDDRPMACVPAYQLGGRNFCAPGCDVAVSPPLDATSVCLPSGPPGPVSGGLLQRCDPSSNVFYPCGHEQLSCLRTDLVADEGVCMTVNTCGQDTDCRDPVRAKCMGELLRETYPAGGLKSNRTYCLQVGCHRDQSACSPGETCLREVLPLSLNPPDICVPNCDANRNCPPNYFCYQDLYSSISPPICIPGLIGLRCRSSIDCLFGECVETGAGFRVCSTPCTNDAECTRYNSVHGGLFCNGQGWCAGVRGFDGAFCFEGQDMQCKNPGEICVRVEPGRALGRCLFPCTPGGKCASYGGVAHTCRPPMDQVGRRLVESERWVCAPGMLEQVCFADDECIAPLTCLPLDPAAPGEKICSVRCTSDETCPLNRFGRRGWCQADVGLCKDARPDGAPCIRGPQCVSGRCTGSGDTAVCADTESL